MLGEYSGQTASSLASGFRVCHGLCTFAPRTDAELQSFFSYSDSERASSGPWLSVMILIGPYFTSQVLLLSAGPITVSGTNAPASRVLQLGVLMRRPRRSPRFSPDSCFDVD